MENYGLNPKQIAFADEYIISGNAERSAIKAGYSERYARSSAHKLVAKVGISSYIADRMAKIQSERIMSAEEVLERLTSIGRRELVKSVYNSKETVNGETIESKKEYEHVPNVEEQTEALKLIGKRYALWTDKVDLQQGDIVVKVGEWDAEDEKD